ncbi:MAG: DUF2112 family protein [Candidatus Verstraetearchaeota archaeon]|nr:DUF2112 family protein [Candidatus Verstraetearchaeota archaeon]
MSLKVLVFPFNSLILSDMVLRRGHKPLTSMEGIAKRVQGKGIDRPPFNIRDEDLATSLTVAPADMPAGAKGRIALLMPLVREAEAAVVMKDAEASFGPSGCLRANMALLYELKKKGIPVLEVEEPKDGAKAAELLKKMDAFLGKPRPLDPPKPSTPAHLTEIVRAYPAVKAPSNPSAPFRIAVLGCGLEYSGVFSEVVEAVRSVGAEVYIPEYSKEKVRMVEDVFGFKPASGDLRALLAQALSLAEYNMGVKGAIVMTCFRCGEGSLVRHVVRSFIVERLRVPVIAYSFTERTRAHNLYLRVEALYNLASKRRLYRPPVKGLALGVDSGSTTTKAVVYDGKEVLGCSWKPTIDIERDVEKVVNEALEKAGLSLSQIDAIGVTGYGRFKAKGLLKRAFEIDDVNSSALGALLLTGAKTCLILDIGGIDSKAVSIKDMVPTGFTIGGTCAGASGRFLEVVASRLGVDVGKLGEMALEGNTSKVKLNAYCAIFGLQDVVALLARGASNNDVAAAVCRSVAEQFYEQFMGDVDVVNPLIHVGGTSLVKGLTEALRGVTGLEVLVPKYSQFAGAVGAAAMALNTRC